MAPPPAREITTTQLIMREGMAADCRCLTRETRAKTFHPLSAPPPSAYKHHTSRKQPGNANLTDHRL